MGLRLRIFVLVLLAAVPVFVVQIVHDLALREDRKATILRNAETLAGLVAARQDRIVEGARLLLTASAYLQSIREQNPELCNRRLSELAGQVPELTAMAVMSPNGDRWCVSIPSTGPINLADREYFQATLRTGTMQSSDFIIGRQTGEGSIVYTYPARGPDGTIQSIVFLAYRASVLSRVLDDPPLPAGAIVAIVDREGVVAARWPDPEKWIGQNLSSSEAVRRAIGDRRGSVQALADWAGPGEFAFAYAPVRPPTHLTVLVGLPLTSALQEIDSLFWREVGWTSLIFALAALLALTGAHLTVVNPLRELHSSLGTLARGSFTAPSGTLARGSRELRQVGEALSATALVLHERQTALRQSEESKAAVIRTGLDCIITIDGSGQIVEFNPAAEQTFGRVRADVMGRTLADVIVPPEYRDGHNAGLARYLSTGEARVLGKRLEMEAMRADGTRFPIDLAIVETRVNGDLFFTGHLRDISDRKRAERELHELNATLEQRVEERTRLLTAANEKLLSESRTREEAEEKIRHMQKMEAVGQLTGGIAHDFNNMLAIVMGSLQLIRKRLDRGDTNIQKYFDAAEDGAERAASLTRRLLAFSRQQPLDPKPLDVNKLIAGMSEFMLRTIPENVKIETVLAGGLWRTNVDAHQLESAILNLVVNSRDAMPDGGRLTIETANSWLDEAYASAQGDVSPGQYVMVAVTDTGAGMPADVAARAFDPFFTTKPTGLGTGLGLSQVHGFIKQSGGHVKIYSEPGHGTTVKIYLARHVGRTDEAAAAENASSGVLMAAANEKILLVEDEERVRHLACEILRELGYQVVEADGADAALRQLDQHPDIALLFTDIVMAGMNGRQLATEALKARPELKVLFTTGYTRNAIVHNGILDSGVSVIMKPYTFEALASKIAGILSSVDKP